MKIQNFTRDQATARADSLGNTVSGDLSGTLPSPIVGGLGGITLNVTNLGDQYVVTYDLSSETFVLQPVNPAVASGHWEIIIDPLTSAPPVPLTNEAATDWLYAFVTD